MSEQLFLIPSFCCCPKYLRQRAYEVPVCTSVYVWICLCECACVCACVYACLCVLLPRNFVWNFGDSCENKFDPCTMTCVSLFCVWMCIVFYHTLVSEYELSVLIRREREWRVPLGGFKILVSFFFCHILYVPQGGLWMTGTSCVCPCFCWLFPLVKTGLPSQCWSIV